LVLVLLAVGVLVPLLLAAGSGAVLVLVLLAVGVLVPLLQAAGRGLVLVLVLLAVGVLVLLVQAAGWGSVPVLTVPMAMARGVVLVPLVQVSRQVLVAEVLWLHARVLVPVVVPVAVAVSGGAWVAATPSAAAAGPGTWSGRPAPTNSQDSINQERLLVW